MASPSRVRIACALIAVAIAVRVDPAPLAAEAEPTEDPDTRAMRGLDARFGTRGALPEPSADRAERLRRFVRDRLAQDAFYTKTLPNLFRILSSRYPISFVPPLPLTLSAGKDGEREFHYVGQPCPRQDQVQVQPWWDLSATVWVCAKDYRPELTTDQRLGEPRSCEYSGQIGHTHGERSCRCGANLTSCARDPQMQADLYNAYFQEVIATVQYVIQQDLPFSRILTMNETVRNDLADFFYARSRAFATGKLAYPKPDRTRPASLRAREPHFDGGILSTYQTIYNGADSHRSTVWQLWEAFLCSPLASANVVADEMFHFEGQTGQLRTAERIELTTKQGCQDCHRELEYASRPLVRGYPSQWQGQRYTPHAIGETKLFVGRGETTPRATGPATLGWLGAAMAAQPEFSACIVQKTEALVYAGLPVPPAVHAQLQQTFAKAQSFQALLEAAVIARHIGLGGLGAGLGGLGAGLGAVEAVRP
jgi:hypothetical protein